MKTKRHPIRHALIWMLMVFIITGAGFYAWSKLRAQYSIVYDAHTASVGSIYNTLSFSGTLQLIDSATYSAKSDTKVAKVYDNLSVGSAVVKNQRLLLLSDGTTIKADFDGTVNEMSISAGDEVKSGDSLLQIADFSHMRVSVRVDEYDINEVSVGDECTVTVTATDQTFHANVSSISHISSSTGNIAYYTALINVDTNDSGVYPGMGVTVSVPRKAADHVVILEMNALSFADNNSAFVYMQDSLGQMIEVPVEVGISNGTQVEIKSGIQEGDTVYSKSEQKTEDAATALFTRFFGTTTINQPAVRRNRTNNNGGNWNMPSGGGMGGGGR